MNAPKRQAQAAQTRGAILDAARALFLAAGYEGTGIRDVAKAAGRSTGAVFQHFDDKDALWEAAMDSPAPSIRAFLARMTEGASALGGDPWAALEEQRRQGAELALALYGSQP